MTTREFLKEATLTRALVDRFLDSDALNWAVFDPELGYLLQDCIAKDGVNGSYTLSRYRPGGERRMIHYADQPCRINTYGDSFTQCHQVSDGETWQEYLAAHFGEPIRNFGIGGYGVYQAYRRMLREENTEASAEYIILNIWSDDHRRSVYAWRWLHIPEFRRRMLKQGLVKTEPCMFHANPWAHVRLNPDSGAFEECENPYPTPESLYRLCDTNDVYETFRTDPLVQLLLVQQGVTDADIEPVRPIADALNVPLDDGSPDDLIRSAETILNHYSLRASMDIIEKARAFAEAHGKRLLILLSYAAPDVVRACQGKPRFDEMFLGYLAERNFRFVDTLHAHAEEFSLYNCDPDIYVRQYYIGHYNPQGNHFFAFAVKDAIVDWLTPKPVAYRDE